MQLNRVIVGTKRVLDYLLKPRVKSDGSAIDINGLKMNMNNFDEIAVEEAVRLKEAGIVKEVVAVSIGPAKSQEVLRAAMGIGADRAVHVVTDEEVEPLAVAKIFAKIAEKEKPELIFLGKQAIDGDNNQTGQMLGGILGWAQATNANKIQLEDKNATVIRETDAGLETIKVTLPAIITCDLRLNQPRFQNLKNIMAAKKKPLDKTTPEDWGVDVSPKLKTLQVEEPKTRSAGIKVQDVDELVTKLKDLGYGTN